VGTIANHGVASVAEDANNAPLEQALPQIRGVETVFTVPGGPIPPGDSRTFEVETLRAVESAHHAGQHQRRLHRPGLAAGPRQGRAIDAIADDAGSERNNELAAFIPGPCCNNPFVRDPEGSLIRPHDGIIGVGDLDPAVHGWPEPAARITITCAP
jgi:hypothetical protein